MKTLKIEDCEECPHHEFNDGNGTSWCNAIEPPYVIRLKEFPVIPSNCPLDEVQDWPKIKDEDWGAMNGKVSHKPRGIKSC